MKLVIHVLIFLFFQSASYLTARELFNVDNMLPKEKIDQIFLEKDFFSRNKYKRNEPPLDIKKLEYGDFFFKDRPQIISYDESVDDAAGRSFNLATQLQNLYQAKMDQQIAIGMVVPSFQLFAGAGLPISPRALFAGLFSFMLPQHWMRIASTSILYKISKVMLLKYTLDTTLEMRLTFLDAHRMARDMEILSFYYSHLELLERYRLSRGVKPESLSILKMALYLMAVRLANTTNNLVLKFNDLAKLMNMVLAEDGKYHSELLHVKMLDDLKDEVESLEKYGPLYKDQDTFIKAAVERSLEMLAVENLVKVADLNIGVQATGDMFSMGTDLTRTSPIFGLSIGYGNVPRILKSVAEQRKSKINIPNELLKFVTFGRNAHTRYDNSERLFQETVRSLTNTRDLFYRVIDKIADDDTIPIDGQLLITLPYILEGELNHNLAIHEALKARKQMDRLLLVNKDRAKGYLPSKIEFDKALDSLAGRKERFAFFKQDPFYKKYIRHIRSSYALEKFLNGYGKYPKDISANDKDAIKEIIAGHLNEFVYPKGRGRKYYEVLDSYIKTNKVHVTPMQEIEIAHYKTNSKFKRLFKKTNYPYTKRDQPYVPVNDRAP